jgi:hypothetical protein
MKEGNWATTVLESVDFPAPEELLDFCQPVLVSITIKTKLGVKFTCNSTCHEHHSPRVSGGGLQRSAQRFR